MHMWLSSALHQVLGHSLTRTEMMTLIRMKMMMPRTSRTAIMMGAKTHGGKGREIPLDSTHTIRKGGGKS